MSSNALNITANGTGTLGSADSNVEIKSVVVNKAGATGNILVLRQTNSTGTVIATIDTTAIREINFHSLRCQDGLYFDLGTGTAADITIFWE